MQCILNKPTGMFDFYFQQMSGVQLFNTRKNTVERVNNIDPIDFLNFHNQTKPRQVFALYLAL